MFLMKKLLLFSLLLIALDQITKLYFVKSINYGAAFGILQGWKYLFVIVSIIVILVIFFYSNKVKKYGWFGLLLLFSGTVGNLIDRIAFGYVRDFIDLGFFPVFNFADAYNTIGVALFVMYAMKHL